MSHVIWARSWYFVLVNSWTASYFAEISNTAAFVFWEKIISFLVDAKSYRIGSWSWQFHFLFILFMRFTIKTIGWFWECWVYFVCAWAWIFVSFDWCKWTSDFHFISTLSETEANCFTWRKISLNVIGIGRRISWCAELL